MPSRAKQIAAGVLKKIDENYRMLNRPDFHSARILVRVLPNGKLFVGFSPSMEEQIDPEGNVDLSEKKE